MAAAPTAAGARTGAIPTARAAAPYRIMVVDDSAVIRGLLTRSLESDPEIAVVASASNGQMAVNSVARHDVEVVVLDIEMPVMDGLTALPQLLAAKPGLKVIVASTLTRRGGEISMKALAAGADDYVTKPGATALTSADDFKRELVAKVKALAQARRGIKGASLPGPVEDTTPAPRTLRPVPAPQRGGQIALRPASPEAPEVIAIGSSTGGPQALFKVLDVVNSGLKQPILITQHMPATFTAILAEHIQRACGWLTAEGVDGEPVRGGRIYVAPGDFHMTIAVESGQKVIRLLKTPPENFCRPSVDPMLRSLAPTYGKRLLCLILTGMGHDGLAGSREVVAAGGTVIAQDEASSIVWGMPGAVATAGLCSAVLPLDEIGPWVRGKAARVST